MINVVILIVEFLAFSMRGRVFRVAVRMVVWSCLCFSAILIMRSSQAGEMAFNGSISVVQLGGASPPTLKGEMVKILGESSVDASSVIGSSLNQMTAFWISLGSGPPATAFFRIAVGTLALVVGIVSVLCFDPVRASLVMLMSITSLLSLVLIEANGAKLLDRHIGQWMVVLFAVLTVLTIEVARLVRLRANVEGYHVFLQAVCMGVYSVLLFVLPASTWALVLGVSLLLLIGVTIQCFSAMARSSLLTSGIVAVGLVCFTLIGIWWFLLVRNEPLVQYLSPWFGWLCLSTLACHVFNITFPLLKGPVRQEQTPHVDLERERLQMEELRRLAKVSAARDAAQRMNDLQSNFLATMSHELRTPLACVVGICRMLANEAGQSESIRQDMGTVERLALQLLRTVDGGLSFVRQNGKIEVLSDGGVRMGHLLRDIKAVAAWLSTQHNNQLRMLKVQNIPSVLYFDEQRMRQVLINLISNASRYCQNGEITLGVTLRTMQGNAYLAWIIEDTGRGMDEHEQKIFFEPFVKSRDSQGLGLGLSLVKRLINEMEGNISLTSEKNRGTRIRVQIPVTVIEARAPDAEIDGHNDNLNHSQQVSAPMQLLPHNELQVLDLGQLRSLVKFGQLSEVEHWLDRAESVPNLSEASRKLLFKLRSAVMKVNLDKVAQLIDLVDSPISFI